MLILVLTCFIQTSCFCCCFRWVVPLQVPVVLLANKCDLSKEGLVKNSAQMNAYCEEKGFAAWFETSAKENLNINTATETLVQKIIENGQGQLSAEPEGGTVKVRADEPKEGSCCG